MLRAALLSIHAPVEGAGLSAWEPQSVVEAFAAGLDIRIQDVRSLDELEADAVVVAAGADTTRLVPGLPIVREERYLFYSEPIGERLLEPLVITVERHLAAKQLGNGRILASDLAARGDDAQQPGWRSHIRAVVEDLLPVLTYVSFHCSCAASTT
jgi:glycine/D-amino acid oxidase-like deaminating enzyme